MKLAIRCNASHSLGLGDVVCGLVLADAARSQGVEPVLIVNDEPVVDRLMQSTKHDYLTVPSGLSPARDALMLEKVLAERRAGMLFVIRFDQDLFPYAGLKERLGLALGCVDFWSAFPPAFDLAVNWDPTAEADYEFSAYPDTVFMLGPRFVFLKPEISGLAPRKAEPAGMEKVLVTMGGTDLNGLTLPVLRALQDHQDPLQVTLVVGAGYKDHAGLREFLKTARQPIEVVENAQDMGRLLNRADLVITAGGLTLFESLVLGRPSLAVAAVKHQEPRCREFSQRGAAVFLGCAGELKTANITDEIDHLADHGIRQKLHAQAKVQVGDEGPALVAGKIKEMMGQ